MSQTDIGFNTTLKKWFLQTYNETRGLMLTQTHLKDSDINLKNVMCDSYAWGPMQGQPQQGMSHGRLRYYNGNETTIQSEGAYSKSAKITGSLQPFKFHRLKGPSVLKYNIQNMTWTITIDGNDFITKNIVGLVSGTTEKQRVRFDLEDAEIYFNTIITLINPDFT